MHVHTHRNTGGKNMRTYMSYFSEECLKDNLSDEDKIWFIDNNEQFFNSHILSERQIQAIKDGWSQEKKQAIMQLKKHIDDGTLDKRRSEARIQSMMFISMPPQHSLDNTSIYVRENDPNQLQMRNNSKPHPLSRRFINE